MTAVAGKIFGTFGALAAIFVNNLLPLPFYLAMGSAITWLQGLLSPLAGIAQHSRSDSARVSAIATMFERGWGKAQNEDGTSDGEIRVVIRNIIEGRDPPTIINTKALSNPEGEP